MQTTWLVRAILMLFECGMDEWREHSGFFRGIMPRGAGWARTFGLEARTIFCGGEFTLETPGWQSFYLTVTELPARENRLRKLT